MRPILLLAALSLILVGCDPNDNPEGRRIAESNRRYEEQNEKAWQACLDRGGIPVRTDSAWTSRMTDCKFPPPQCRGGEVGSGGTQK